MAKEKTVDEVLATLNDEQKKAVAVFASVMVENELRKRGIKPDTNLMNQQDK